MMTRLFALKLVMAVGLSLSTSLSAQPTGSDAVPGTALRDDHVGTANQRYYLAALAAAEKSLRLHEVAEARRWLEVAPVASRGWEWFNLQGPLDESSSTTPLPSEMTTAIAAAPNGEWVAIARRQRKY